jgi:hypothetical protein
LKNDTWQRYYGNISSRLTFFKDFGSLESQSATNSSLGGYSEKV